MTSLAPQGDPSAQQCEKLRTAIAETCASKEIVLFGPEIGISNNNGKLGEWGLLLKTKPRENGGQYVCRVPRAVYEAVVHRDQDWRAHVEIIFIHGETRTEVPIEL